MKKYQNASLKLKKRIEKKRRKRKFKIALLFIIFILVASCSIYYLKLTYFNNKTEISNSEIKKENSQISLIACGDIMIHDPQLKAQYNTETGEYSFDNNFKYVKKYIQKPDLAIANLETTLCKDDIYPYSSYPKFNTPDAIADALKNAGFDLLSTINNHSFDKSSIGVERTLATLKEKGFDTVGTREEKSDDEYVIKDINDIKIGVTAYTYGQITNDGTKYLNGIKVSDDKTDLMNVFQYDDADKAFDTINSTVEKFKDTDLQVVIIHWGVEYNHVPNEFQTELAQKLCDSGVDIIIGSHPHVVQPVEMIESTDGENETLVIYSLGNYISNQRREILSKDTEDGLMVNIDIEKSDSKATIKKVTCIPTLVNKYSVSGKNIYEIIPIAGDILEKAAYINSNYLKESYNATSSLIKTDDKIEVIESPFENQ